MDQLDAETMATIAPAVAVAAEATGPRVAGPTTCTLAHEEVAPFNEDVFRVRERAAGVSYR